MKTHAFFFILVATFLFVADFANAQINVDCNSNNVGIGGSPGSNKLKVTGSVTIAPGSNNVITIDNSGYSSNPSIYGMANVGKSGASCYDVNSYYFTTASDERLKENIKDISSGLDLILKLEGKKYDYKTDAKEDKKLSELKKNHVGFLAQDVVKIIPETVLYDDSADIYSIDYTKFIPFITEAIKEQQRIIENLQTEIQVLKSGTGSNANLKGAALISAATDTQASSLNELYQNAPNPFSQNTTIGYSLAKNVQKAMICIYDMNGTQLKCNSLEIKAHGNITVNGNEFKAGIYLYSLIVDGQLIDSKRMVLTN